MSRKKTGARAPKERNAFVPAMRARKSGPHGPTGKAIRRKEKMTLRAAVRKREAFVA